MMDGPLDPEGDLPAPSRPEETLMVTRGVRRHLVRLGFAVVEELPLASGRRADLMGLSAAGEIWIVEVKSSVEDFRVDRKWPFYRAHCDRLFFATSPRVPLDIFPEDCGLMLADAHGADILREAPEHRLAAATRKATTLRFARAAAARLFGFLEPGLLGNVEIEI